jgi:medium-chain acyl-[acyl-carrier-protein] hydrolase
MSQWLRTYSKCEQPRIRLFCFPYAGGNANIFSAWPNYLPDYVEVVAIQSPGRGGRFSEQPIGCLQTQVTLLHRELLGCLDLPYVFVGHSNGALLAFELARELQKSGNCNLQHIILSAKRAIHLPKVKPVLYNLSDSEFIQRLKEYDFTPTELLSNEEMMQLLMPMLRADFALSDTYQYRDTTLLKTHATLFWGKLDKDVPYQDVLAWQELIDGHVETLSFSDGHFFIATQREQFLAYVRTKLVELCEHSMPAREGVC